MESSGEEGARSLVAFRMNASEFLKQKSVQDDVQSCFQILGLASVKQVPHSVRYIDVDETASSESAELLGVLFHLERLLLFSFVQSADGEDVGV